MGPYVIEPMRIGDIQRVVDIEQQSFTTPWPSNAYRRELQENRMAHYIVARDLSLERHDPTAHNGHDTPSAESWRRLFPMSLFSQKRVEDQARIRSIVGYAGLWLMVDEAHITNIAVIPGYRGHGVGELLMVALVEMAMNVSARVMTLEVRVSNTIAQRLYYKYSFRQEGIRYRYYSDNNEDALIMTTPDIANASFQANFQALRARLRERLDGAKAHEGETK